MIFNSIRLEEDGRVRIIEFSNKNNLIFSQSNSKGKTTLLRILLYSIGYNIPNTKLIKFEKCKVETHLTLDSGESIILIRDCKHVITLKSNDIEQTYILPSQENDLHQSIFSASNFDLIKNILGTFYFDQEKGWTLLNRGVVIGSIHFNIEALIRGLANIDCSELIRLKEKKKQDLAKYQQMSSVSKYQETLDAEKKNLVTEPYDSQIENTLNQYRMELSSLKRERDRISKVLKDNVFIKKFISEIGLLIETENGEVIAVNENNIYSLNDSINLLQAKLKIVAAKYNQITEKIQATEKARTNEVQQLSFFDDEKTIAEIFDQKIASIPINAVAVQSGISKLEKEIKVINEEIKRATLSATQIITSISQRYIAYRNELGLNNTSGAYLFTSNLKELSGAILHKSVFALRLACLSEIQKQLSIKLPIILDSPRGKEIDLENIEKMIEILNRDFADNQIIIASIFEYNLPETNKIEIFDRLIE